MAVSAYVSSCWPRLVTDTVLHRPCAILWTRAEQRSAGKYGQQRLLAIASRVKGGGGNAPRLHHVDALGARRRTAPQGILPTCPLWQLDARRTHHREERAPRLHRSGHADACTRVVSAPRSRRPCPGVGAFDDAQDLPYGRLGRELELELERERTAASHQDTQQVGVRKAKTSRRSCTGTGWASAIDRGGTQAQRSDGAGVVQGGPHACRRRCVSVGCSLHELQRWGHSFVLPTPDAKAISRDTKAVLAATSGPPSVLLSVT